MNPHFRAARPRRTSAAWPAFVLIGLASPALAQEAAAAKGAPAGGQTVGEVVVTAQFRSQNVQKTPLAVTAVNAAMMDARSQTTVADVANRAPSVTFAPAGGGLGGSQATAITIRGIGQSDFNLALEPGVGMYVDDVYYGTMYGSMLDLLDLDRVEILRGPQGTLSGKNSEGGAVKLFSKQPSAAGGGYIEATGGSYNRAQVRAAAGFTVLPDKLFVRITGLGEREDGYVTRYDYQCATGRRPDALGAIPSLAPGGPSGCKLGTEGGKDVVAVRAAARYVASDSLENTVTYDVTHDRSDPPPAVLVYQGAWHGPGYNLLGAPGPNPAANFVPPPHSYYNYATYTGLVGTPGQYTLPAVDALDAWGLSNVLDAKLGHGLSLKSISAVRHLDQQSVDDADASPFARMMNLWAVKYTQYTQELRLSGSTGGFADWTVGGFYFRSDALQGGRISLDGAGDSVIPFFTTTDFLFDDPVTVESKSAFAHVELHPAPKVTLTGGLRYTDDYKRYDFTRSFAPGYTPGPIDLAIAATNGASAAFRGSRIDWRGVVAYQATDEINLYAQYASGFKGGGVNPRPYYLLQVQSFQPETVDSYEIGVKSQGFDRRVRVNAAFFYNQYQNMQLELISCPQFVPAGAPQNCQMPANVGSATIKGVELEGEFHPVAGLTIDASGNWLDFHYDKVDPATGIRPSDKPPFTPAYKLTLGGQYEFDLGKRGSLTPRIDYQYQAEEYAETINYPNGRIAPYGLVNLRLTWRDPRGDWEVSGSATNLLGKYYALGRYDQSPPANTPATYAFGTIEPGRPRELSLTVKRRF